MPDRLLRPHPILQCDLLVFDLDGTLVDSRVDLTNSVNATLMHLHRDSLSAETIATFIGDGASMLVQRALQATGSADDALLQQAMPFFLDFYRAHKLDFTYVYDGVLTALREIRTAAPDLPMAVLTNKPVRPSRAICEGLGLSEFFFANYGGDSFATKKPNPEGLLAIMAGASKLRGRALEAMKCVLVGDSPIDVLTARAAGMRCIGCRYGLDPAGLAAARADIEVDSASEWTEALRSLFPVI